MELRTVGSHEVDLIEDLFQEVYNREQGIKYWKWCFKNPYGYLNSGIFEENRLISYLACGLTENSGCMYSAMTHPKHRGKRFYLDVSYDLHDRLSLLRDYVYLFSNEKIRHIHRDKEGYKEVYQIKEYRIPFDGINDQLWVDYDNFSEYEIWRYRNNPVKEYLFHYDRRDEHKAIYSLYEDRVQILTYNNDPQRAIDIGMYITKGYSKKMISFWSEEELDFPYVLNPTWKHYKILNPLNIDMEDIMKNDKTRMGMSDVF